MNQESKLYQDFFKAYKLAYPSKTGATAQNEANTIWKSEIYQAKKEINMEVYHQWMNKLRKIAENNGKKMSLLSYFNKATDSKSPKNKGGGKNSSPTDQPSTSTTVPSACKSSLPELNFDSEERMNNDKDEEGITLEEVLSPPKAHSRCTPAQDDIKAKLQAADRHLANLTLAKQSGVANYTEKELKAATDERKSYQKRLNKLQSNVKSSQKLRDKRKANDEKIRKDHPELASEIRLTGKIGRPRLEELEENENLLRDILQIATIGAACSDKRREDIFRTVKTVDDLHNAITGLGYNVSRSGLYLKLIPRRQNSTEGKRHVNTVPVKLTRPENDLRKKHPDRQYAAESYNSVKDLVTIIGPKAAFFLSQDDKASVHIGKTAAKEQSHMLMNMRVRVRLPDHDFSVGSRHLLCPSVIAECKVSFHQKSYNMMYSESERSKCTLRHFSKFSHIFH